MNSSISSAALRVGFCVSTLSIFIIPTLTSLNIAVAVLYALLILIAMNSFCVYGLCVVSLACAGLTLAAYFISHCDELLTSALARCLVSLIAITFAASQINERNLVFASVSEQQALVAREVDRRPYLSQA